MNRSSNTPARTNTQMQEALRALRQQEIPHLSATEIQPSARPLPPIDKIGRDGVDHLNISRHQGKREELSYTLSFSNRVPFQLDGISRAINSLGSLYVFLRHGGKYPQGLDLDVTGQYRNFQRQHEAEKPVPNMYAVLAFAIWSKFTTVPGFADLLKATGDIPFDYYIPGNNQDERHTAPRRFSDSALIASIYGHVRRCIANDAPFNMFNYLDEPTRLSFEIHHNDVKTTAADKAGYAQAAVEAVLADLDQGIVLHNSIRQTQQAKVAAKQAKTQPRAAGNNRRPTPQDVVAQRLNPHGYTYNDIISGRAKREEQEREAQAAFAQQQAQADAAVTTDERFALPADDGGAGDTSYALAAGNAPANPVVPPVVTVSEQTAAAILAGTQVRPAAPAPAEPQEVEATTTAEDGLVLHKDTMQAVKFKKYVGAGSAAHWDESEFKEAPKAADAGDTDPSAAQDPVAEPTNPVLSADLAAALRGVPSDGTNQ